MSHLPDEIQKEETPRSCDINPNPPVLNNTDESDETYTQATLGGSQTLHSGGQKILGVKCKVDTDQFVVSLEDIAQIAESLDPTERNIVSLVGKFYDPLGILAPVVVKFKVFLHTMCEANLEWDQLLTTNLLQWQKLNAGLLEAQTISIPRCCTKQADGESISYTLCGFCDAQLGAYATVVYVLVETEVAVSEVFSCQDECVSSQEAIPVGSADDQYFSEFGE